MTSFGLRLDESCFNFLLGWGGLVAVHGFYRIGSVFLFESEGFFRVFSSFLGVLWVVYRTNSFFFVGLCTGWIFDLIDFADWSMGSFFLGIINSSYESPVILVASYSMNFSDYLFGFWTFKSYFDGSLIFYWHLPFIMFGFFIFEGGYSISLVCSYSSDIFCEKSFWMSSSRFDS